MKDCVGFHESSYVKFSSCADKRNDACNENDSEILFRFEIDGDENYEDITYEVC